jgi:hypothetical protein
MMPSLFSMAGPVTVFQVWFIVYVYLLPILLYATWASLSIMDIVEANDAKPRWSATIAVILLPLIGGGWYLLTQARTLRPTARIAIVALGSIVWLIPLCTAIWLVGRPLGPKALS